jgi:hypothetical protein
MKPTAGRSAKRSDSLTTTRASILMRCISSKAIAKAALGPALRELRMPSNNTRRPEPNAHLQPPLRGLTLPRETTSPSGLAALHGTAQVMVYWL